LAAFSGDHQWPFWVIAEAYAESLDAWPKIKAVSWLPFITTWA
jgi:hypothetical protein